MKKISRQQIRTERRNFEKVMGITITKALDDLEAASEDAYGLTRKDIELFVLFGDALIEDHVADAALWSAWESFKTNAIANTPVGPPPMTKAEMKVYMTELATQMAEEHAAKNGITRVTREEFEALDEDEKMALVKAGGLTITGFGSISYGFGDDDDDAC